MNIITASQLAEEKQSISEAWWTDSKTNITFCIKPSNKEGEALLREAGIKCAECGSISAESLFDILSPLNDTAPAIQNHYH